MADDGIWWGAGCRGGEVAMTESYEADDDAFGRLMKVKYRS